MLTHTTDVKLFFRRLIEFVRRGAGSDADTDINAATTSADISEPLLIFVLHMLKTKDSVRLFHQVDGFEVCCNRFFFGTFQILFSSFMKIYRFS